MNCMFIGGGSDGVDVPIDLEHLERIKMLVGEYEPIKQPVYEWYSRRTWVAPSGLKRIFFASETMSDEIASGLILIKHEISI
ncbi:MAG: hypothetical protein Q7R66_18720 [Undibacterium sp.]|uniref:hypothetical protein n=1 Tax=Undibacterium sp. TaxID=1914977 RepID=UPI00271763B6|nr:hypothetical protein [Undibacterium sp.]MDO8654210.1 hypothetical protein [Undibacterium sp.]